MERIDRVEKFIDELLKFRDMDCGECNGGCVLNIKCKELGHTYCQALSIVVSHLYDVVEDEELMKMVQERDKRDNGKRYSLDEVKKLIKQ
ncbi:MAG: hypothetical protein ACRC1P_09765 [Cellulosilyticaceae bacterium]